jgi:hypothetical protein
MNQIFQYPEPDIQQRILGVVNALYSLAFFLVPVRGRYAFTDTVFEGKVLFEICIPFGSPEID